MDIDLVEGIEDVVAELGTSPRPSSSMRCAIAVELLGPLRASAIREAIRAMGGDMPAGSRHAGWIAQINGIAAASASRICNVGVASINAARNIKATDPMLFAAIREGGMTVREAVQFARGFVSGRNR